MLASGAAFWWKWISDFKTLSLLTAAAHFIQFVAVLVLYLRKFKDIPRDIIFVSGVAKLVFPNSMIHKTDGVFDGGDRKTTCQDALDVINSPAYRAFKHLDNGEVVLRGPDGSVLLDTRSTTFVSYFDRRMDYSLDISILIMFFFILSFVFQILNVLYLRNASNDAPRYIQYVEYSVSASLTVVILALNVGIQDLFSVITIFVLFFGMNVFGILAEFMMYLEEKTNAKGESMSILPRLGVRLKHLWLIPHLCGWVLFFFAWVPIVLKFDKIQGCSENSQGKGVPWFITLGTVIESLCYMGFGALQLAVLVGRTWMQRVGSNTWKDLLDYGTVLLSLLAKTFLAWILLGPLWSAQIPAV